MSILKSFWVENVLTWRQPVCRPARLPALPAPAWPTLLAPLCCSLDPILPALHPYGALGCVQQVWWDLVTGCQSPIWTRWLSGASLRGGVEASISSHLLFQPPQMALQTCTRPFVRALMSILKSFWVENVLTWRQPVCRPARLPALPAPAWPTLLAPLCCSLDPILPALHPYGALGCVQQVWWDLVTGCQSPIWTRWLSGASLGGGGWRPPSAAIYFSSPLRWLCKLAPAHL